LSNGGVKGSPDILIIGESRASKVYSPKKKGVSIRKSVRGLNYDPSEPTKVRFEGDGRICQSRHSPGYQYRLRRDQARKKESRALPRPQRRPKRSLNAKVSKQALVSPRATVAHSNQWAIDLPAKQLEYENIEKSNSNPPKSWKIESNPSLH